MEINDNDTISLMLRGHPRLSYTFKVTPASTVHTEGPPSTTDKRHSVLVDNNNGDLMAKQIAALQQENQVQEQRMAATLAKLETTRQESFTVQKELRNNISNVAALTSELHELKQHCTSVEANATAAAARIHQLEVQHEEKDDQLESQRQLIITLQEELLHKSNQLDARVTMLDEANAAVALEHSVRVRAEETCELLRQEVAERTAEGGFWKGKCTGLQTHITDIESQLHSSQVIQTYIILICSLLCIALSSSILGCSMMICNIL